MLFTFKKVLGGLLMPLPMVLVLLMLALVLLQNGYRRIAKTLMCFSVTLLYLCSIHPVASLAGAPLEYMFPKYAGQPVTAVIVLGGYHRSDARLPITSLLSSTSLVRLSEGVRIYRLNPGSKLCLSGYAGRDEISQAEAMAAVAEHMGVPMADIVLQVQPSDTHGEAAVWSQALAGQQIALVSSAMHLPRAMRLFAEHGTTPVPAPTNYQTGPISADAWRDWLPNAGALRTVEAAWHEYLGIMWAQLRKAF